MKIIALLFMLASISCFGQAHIEVSESDISVKVRPRKIIFDKFEDGSYVDVYDGKRLLFSTYTSDSVIDAKREIESFINLQKMLAKAYNKKLVIDPKAAEKPAAPIGEVKALFSFKEPAETESKVYEECLDKLKGSLQEDTTAGISQLDKKLTNALVNYEVLYVDEKDLVVKYVPEKILGMHNAVHVDIYVKGKLIHSLQFGASSVEAVHRELTPTLTLARKSKQPMILQFGKSQKKKLLKSQTERFKELFSQN